MAEETGSWITTSRGEPADAAILRDASPPETRRVAEEAYYVNSERTPYRFIAIISPVLFLVRIPVEHAIEPTWWKLFLPFRLGAAVLGLAVYLGLGRVKRLTELRMLCFTLVAYIGAVNALVVVPRVEHFESSYMGLLMLICGCAAMIPWSVGYSAACYGFIWLAYLVGLASSAHGLAHIGRPRLDSFFLVGIAGAIATLGIHLRRRLVVLGFNTSYALKERNEQLGAALESVRRTEARLALSEKLGALGRVTAGVAHEINNPLAYVVANTTYVIGELETVIQVCPVPMQKRLADALTAMREIEDGGHRVKQIVTDLQTFSREAHDTFAAVDLTAVLEASIDMTWNEVRHRARLVRDFGDARLVLGIESRLVQLFVNLLVNSAQAIEDGRSEQNEVRVSLGTAADGNAIVRIADTGCGIAAENLSRIFDPFFTTKGVGGGPGLGLSVCSGIVRNHNGRIHVESEPGRGTAVTVELPCVAGPVEVTPDPSGESEPRQSRILLIDDEPSVGTSLQRMLKPHRVEHCLTVSDALGRIAVDRAYDAVLCDLMMPDQTGMDFYASLGETAPELVRRVAFITGGAFTESAREFLGRSGIIHLEKPVEKRDLLRIIDRLRLTA